MQTGKLRIDFFFQTEWNLRAPVGTLSMVIVYMYIVRHEIKPQYFPVYWLITID